MQEVEIKETLGQGTSFVTTAKISQSQTIVMPDYYSKVSYFYYEKKDAEKVKKEYFLFCKKTKRWIHCLRQFLLLVCGAFMGTFASGFVSRKWLPSSEGWFCFVVSPIVVLSVFVIYILVGLINKQKEAKLAETVNEHLLIPLGMNEEKNNE